jgi:hypothetical protein
MNDNTTETPPIEEGKELTPEEQALFIRLAEISRKAIENMVGDLANSIDPVGLNGFYQKFAVLTGMATANVTLLVGLLDECGLQCDPALLNTLVTQQSGVWNQIMERKAAEVTVQ